MVEERVEAVEGSVSEMKEMMKVVLEAVKGKDKKEELTDSTFEVSTTMNSSKCDPGGGNRRNRHIAKSTVQAAVHRRRHPQTQRALKKMKVKQRNMRKSGSWQKM